MTYGFITELADNDLVPGFYGKTNFGVGPLLLSSLPWVFLLVGMKASGGTLTNNTSAVCASLTDAATLAGEGSELYRMAAKALSVVQGLGGQLYIATPAPASGTPTVATATITIDGGWTVASGTEWRYRIAGDFIRGGISTSDTPQTVAAAIAAAVTARGDMAVTAASAAGTGTSYVVTLSSKNTGARYNDYILVQDKSLLPSGMTSVIAGGASVGNGGCRFHSGTGTEDITALLTNLSTMRYDRIAAAQKDSTNLGLWAAQLDSEAGPFIGHLEHACFAVSNSLSSVTSLATTTMNDQRCQLLWMLDSETPPPEIAAVFMAQRWLVEKDTPNVSYDGFVLPTVQGQTDLASIPVRSTLVSALDVGITPITTTSTGKAAIIRSITTRSLTATGDPDDRTIDTSDAAVPDRIRDELNVFWTTDFVVNNPYVRDNRAPGEKQLPPKVATPDKWNNEVSRILLARQDQGWVTKVETNPPFSVFNANAKRIASRVPVIVAPLQHQIEVTVNQVPYNTAA